MVNDDKLNRLLENIEAIKLKLVEHTRLFAEIDAADAVSTAEIVDTFAKVDAEIQDLQIQLREIRQLHPK